MCGTAGGWAGQPVCTITTRRMLSVMEVHPRLHNVMLGLYAAWLEGTRMVLWGCQSHPSSHPRLRSLRVFYLITEISLIFHLSSLIV